MELKARDRVNVATLLGECIGVGTLVNYNDFREEGMEYAVLIDEADDVIFVGAWNLEKNELEDN